MTEYAKELSPSHGENRGSIPLGSANEINKLRQLEKVQTVTNCDAPKWGGFCPACGLRAISILMDDLYDPSRGPGNEWLFPAGDVCENDPHTFHPTWQGACDYVNQEE